LQGAGCPDLQGAGKFNRLSSLSKLAEKTARNLARSFSEKLKLSGIFFYAKLGEFCSRLSEND
jgi:hypothetical protein